MLRRMISVVGTEKNQSETAESVEYLFDSHAGNKDNFKHVLNVRCSPQSSVDGAIQCRGELVTQRAGTFGTGERDVEIRPDAVDVNAAFVACEEHRTTMRNRAELNCLLHLVWTFRKSEPQALWRVSNRGNDCNPRRDRRSEDTSSNRW